MSATDQAETAHHVQDVATTVATLAALNIVAISALIDVRQLAAAAAAIGGVLAVSTTVGVVGGVALGARAGYTGLRDLVTSAALTIALQVWALMLSQGQAAAFYAAGLISAVALLRAVGAHNHRGQLPGHKGAEQRRMQP